MLVSLKLMIKFSCKPCGAKISAQVSKYICEGPERLIFLRKLLRVTATEKITNNYDSYHIGKIIYNLPLN